MRFLVSEGRVYLPSRRLLQTELEDLEMSPDGKKVSHPEKRSDGTPGSRDMADGVCGALRSALSREERVKRFYANLSPSPGFSYAFSP